ncbi:MAG: DUF4126 domain-containing protein [Acidobacteria bacterium]|nr:DUF4126 domain-containing protein [Acidobacteriota bacterium]
MSSAIVQTLGLAMGASYASGLRLYATVAVLGLLQHFGIVRLPGSLSVLANPIVIAVALVLCAAEFLMDKVPYVGSAWNAFHTFVRPPAAALLSYGAFSSAPPQWRVLAALLGGAVALSSHSAKMALRTPIEASPEPFSTSAVSLGEDGLTALLAWLAAAHPVISIIIVTALLAAAFYLTMKLYRAFRGAAGRFVRILRSG